MLRYPFQSFLLYGGGDRALEIFKDELIFNRFVDRQVRWQSEDGRILAGTARLAAEGPRFQYAWLGGRAVTLADVQGLLAFLEAADPALPLLLGSSCPGFPVSADAERAGLAFFAGAYRRLLEARKRQGLTLVSLVAGTAVGGTYLMHGLAAPVRLAMHGTAFYDTVFPGRCVSLEAARAQGLVTRILEPGAWVEALEAALFGQARP